MACLGDAGVSLSCTPATLATDATHLEGGAICFTLILLQSEIGFTGDEVSVSSPISATLATDATHVEDGEASFPLISGLDLSLLSIESDKSVSGCLAYSSFLWSIICSICVTTASTSL